MEVDINLLDPAAWEAFTKTVEALAPTEEQLHRAMGSTCKRMADWLRTRAIRALAEELKVPQKLLRRRFKSFRFFGETRGGKVWFGLDKISYIWLEPVPYDKGVRTRVGGHYTEGAFIAKGRKTGRMRVLKRRGKTWENPGKRGPVYTVGVSLEENVIKWLKTALDRPEFERVFYERLEKELQWRMSL